MSSPASLLRVIVVMLPLAAYACGGDPPDKEMQQAQGAIDAARAAGADVYAHDEFVAAQQALTHAAEAVAQRDYRLALNHALDSLERAQNAAKMAADGKAAARVEADRAIARATGAIDELRGRLKAAESRRVPPRALVAPRRVLTTAERRVQEARTAFDNGNYSRVGTAVNGIPEEIAAAIKPLGTLPAPSSRRRR